jgi:hypothetical protein
MRNESIGRWLLPALLFGMVAGVVFALFEMLAAWAMGDGFWMPLRMIGAIVLGEEALQASYSLAGAAVTGALVHTALSGLFGAAFGLLLAAVPGLGAGRGVLVAAASLYGLALWIVNFYVIAPVAFEWFQDADPVVQFVAHTLFFGVLLGALLAGRVPAHAERPHRRREQPLGI